MSARIDAAVDPNDLEANDLEATVRSCAHAHSGGRLVSTAHAVEELRIRTGDFVSSDEELTAAVSAMAIELGCAVLLDEAIGPGPSTTA
jgi:hypothetical protein